MRTGSGNGGKTYSAGIYLRLSDEDDDSELGQSRSIINQRDMLSEFISSNGWTLTDVYCDDGYSGTNFNRPGFRRMIRDIESGRINMVATKDLSRLGRDYIETGYYIERYFPEHGVRYIAVNDGIDTCEKGAGNDMSPFKAVMNDLYSKDISKKIKSAMDIKKKTGKFIGAFAPYGYRKSAQDRNKLVVSGETASVVKRIYNMFIEGHGYSRIARTLQSEGILPPAAHKSLETNYRNTRMKGLNWTPETVKSILTNPTYAGNLTQNRCEKLNYKSRKLILLPKSKWITVDNTHEPIVDKESFELVQRMIGMKPGSGYASKKCRHLLAGLVFCADCGGRMTFSKTPGNITYCICSSYKRFKTCSRHSVTESELESAIREVLAGMSERFCDRERLLAVAKTNELDADKAGVASEVNRTARRISEVRTAIKSLYEDRLKGILEEEDFKRLYNEYRIEGRQLKARLDELSSRKRRLEDTENRTLQEARLVDDFVRLGSIDRVILAKLVKRIEINQNGIITIHFNFRKPC